MKFCLDSKRLAGNGKNDIDNLIKPVLDSMKKVGLIHDDASIFHVSVTKLKTESQERLELSGWEWLC